MEIYYGKFGVCQKTLMISLRGGGYKVKDILGKCIWKWMWRNLSLRWSLPLLGLRGNKWWHQNGTVMESLCVIL